MRAETTRKVMVVDDDPSVLTAIAYVIRSFGWTVVAVQRADEILRQLRLEHPDALLQDIHMRGMDLSELLGAIRADPGLRDLPVVLISGAPITSMAARRIGADAMVQKPFPPGALRGVIERAIDRGVAFESGEPRRPMRTFPNAHG